MPLGEANPEKKVEKSILHDAAKYIGLDADKIVPVDKVNSVFKEEHDIAIGNVPDEPSDKMKFEIGYTEMSRTMQQKQHDHLILDQSDQQNDGPPRSIFFPRQKKEWLDKLKKSDK